MVRIIITEYGPVLVAFCTGMNISHFKLWRKFLSYFRHNEKQKFSLLCSNCLQCISF